MGMIVYSFPILSLELKKFLQCVTGSTYYRGNAVYVHYTSNVECAAFSFGTCGNQLTVNTLIEDEEDGTDDGDRRKRLYYALVSVCLANQLHFS